MKPRILLVEDEEPLARILGDYLTHSEMDHRWIDHGGQALEAFREYKPDLVLLDLMLPGVDGLTICREIRKVSETPVMMVTAKVEELDRLLGLELGADDYICKPYSPREVVARVKVVLRRLRPTSRPQDSLFRCDEAAQMIYVQGQRLDLTPTEYRLLRLFLSHPGRVYSRDSIVDLTYDMDQEVTDRVVDSHIKNLRKKIARELPDREVIYSVYGVGYRFEI
ncbi:two-component system response regulator BaeR [bacterium SCN 62-11]|nr:response regulator [Candidatus Eremiobacteraeota bacterium]ODT76538.1 MAG: two-component system response regulator BaeR [bacterium SCN 62-11]